MQSIISEHLLNLRSIWDQVGLDEDQRRDRIDSVINHVDSLFCDMTNEEREMSVKLVETIKEYNEEIFVLSKELHWTHTEVTDIFSFLNVCMKILNFRPLSTILDAVLFVFCDRF